jgi:hypothetical protein
MHYRANFEFTKTVSRYRIAREVKVWRAFYFDEAIVLIWKNTDHYPSLSRRPMLLNFVIAYIRGLTKLPLNGLKYAIDDCRLVALHLMPVLLPLGNDWVLTGHVDLNRDADWLLTALGAAVGDFHHDTCSCDVRVKALQSLDPPTDQCLEGLRAIHVLESDLQRSFHRLLRSYFAAPSVREAYSSKEPKACDVPVTM